MPKIPSQRQIDELLRELMGSSPNSMPDTGEKRVKPYNFKTPKKLSRDQQKVLTGIYEIFARHMAAYLAGLTRSYCEVNIASIEEHPYFEYNNALPDIQMTGIIDVSILRGSMLLDMSNSVSFALIERTFGGTIEDRAAPSRDFTEIELALMDRVFKKATYFIEEAWAHIPNVSASLRQLETNTRFIKSVSMDETVAVVVLNVKINTVKGTVTCCVPCMNIGEVLDTMNGGMEKTAQDCEESERVRQAILKQVSEANVEVCGILGTSTITMREALELQPGDVIKLDQPLDTPMLVTVNGKKWFDGCPGTNGNQMAVKIGRLYRKEGYFA